MMTLSGYAQNNSNAKDDLFVGTEVFAKNATNVTEITMDPDTLKQVDGKDAKAARTTVLNVVRTYSYDKPGMFRMEDVDAFRNKLQTGDWHCSVHTRDLKTGDSTDICNKRRTDDLKETAIVTVSATSLTFIHTIRKAHASSSGVVINGEHVYSYGGDAVLAPMSPRQEADIQAAMAQLEMLQMPAMQERLQMAISKNMPAIQKQVDEAMAKVRAMKATDGYVQDLLPDAGGKAPVPATKP